MTHDWPPKDKVLLVLCGGLGLGLRFWNLDGKSLWLDEAYSVWRAALPIGKIWNMTSDPHPPGYYLLLHQFLTLGTSETTARLPSAIASVLSVVLLFVLGKRLFRRDVGYLATALLAVSALDIWYAQETRMYVFVGTTALLAAIGVTIPSWRGVFIVATGLTLGLYLDYAMLPLWFAMSGILAVFCSTNTRWPGSLYVWLSGSLLAALATIPLWPHLHTLSRIIGGSYLMQDLTRLLGLSTLSGSAYGLVLASLGIISATTTLSFRFLSRRSPAAAATIGASALLTVAVLSPFPRLYTLKKFLVTGWPFVVLLTAWLITCSPRWRSPLTRLVLVASVIAAAVGAVSVAKDDWRGVVAYLDSHREPGEEIWLDPSSDSIPYNYYKPTHAPFLSQLKDEALDPDHLVARTTIWLVVQRRFGWTSPGSPSEAWLDRNSTLTKQVPFARLELRRYEVVP